MTDSILDELVLNIPDMEVFEFVERADASGTNVLFAQLSDSDLVINYSGADVAEGDLEFIIIDGAEVPLSVLQGNVEEIEPAAGPDTLGIALSGGGSGVPFDLGSIGPNIDITDLLPPTALFFTNPEEEELTVFVDDRNDQPAVEVIPDDPADPATVAPVTLLPVDASANETALPDGADPTSNDEITTGELIIDTGTDTLASVVIDGVDVTTGGTVSGEYGTLTISVTPDGTYEFTYELTDNTIDHPDAGSVGTNEGIVDDFEVVVTDDDGDVATDSLVIGILDDGPVAIDDSITQLGENAPVIIDVLENDTEGADGVDPDAGVVFVDGSLTGAGDLTDNGDGTFTYIPDASDSDTVTFQYQITDGDGDADIATVTITLNEDSEPIVEVLADVPSLGAGDASVDEAALDLIGSDAASNTETTTGDFAIDTGGDDLAGLVVGGIDVTQGGMVDGTYGTLTVTLNPDDTYSWSYELTDVSQGDDNQDSFTVAVTDEDGDIANDTLVIDILDDVPDALDDSADQVGENSPVTVDVLINDVEGADGVDPDAGVIFVDGSLTGTGEVADNGDGTFTYTPGAGEVGVVTFQYEITDGDGDTDIATVTINLNDDSDPVVEVVADVPSIGAGDASVSEPALDVGSNPSSDLEITTGDFVIDTGGDGLASFVVGGVDVTQGGTVDGTYGTLTVTLNSDDTYSWSYELTEISQGDDNQDNFTVVVTDEDGDIADDTLVVDIVDDVPNAQNDSANQMGEGTPITINVLANDVEGADGVDPDAGVVFVDGSLTGTGVVTDNGDGTFTYNPGAGDNDTVTFQYQITDGDGDTDIATVTINLNDDSEPIVEVIADFPYIGAGDASVDEAALDIIGSDAVSDAETTTGEFAIDTGNDTLASLVVGGIDVTQGGTVDGTYGTLTVTLNPDDTYSYSYELTEVSSGDDNQDSFTVVVTDEDGDTADDTLVIDIIDDVPMAEDDSGSVSEDITLIASGNVITENDIVGADGAAVTNVDFGGTDFAPGAIINTDYGTITVADDGTYTYELDNTNGDVQGLAAGETLTETVTYTLTDGDGDVDTAILTITINGTDDGVTISGLDVGGGELTFDEADLSDGSSPDAGALTDTGTFGFEALDGADDVTLGGVDLIVDGVFVGGPISITTPYGEVTVTGFSPETAPDGTVIGGTFDYAYELSDNTLDHGNPGQDGSLVDSLDFVVTDRDGSTATDTLDVNITDDVPAAVDDTDEVSAGTYGPVAGNVITDAEANGDTGADTSGADGALISGVMAGDTNTVIDDGSGVGAGLQGAYGVLTLNDDGSYSYTRNPGTDGGVEDVFTYTLTDGDGDSVTATLTVTIADSGVEVVIPLSGDAGTVVDEAGLPVRPSESEGSDAAADSETTSGTITFVASDGPVTVSIDGTDVTVVGQTFMDTTGTLEITAINAESIEYTYTLADNTTGDNTFVDFDVVVTDQDGDTAGGTLTINIIDDVPTAVLDMNSVTEGATLTVDAAGGVLTNDTLGADSAVIDGVRASGGDETTDVSGGLGAPIAGLYGTLTLDADGSYTYEADPNAIGADTIDVFVYTLVDSDGDTSTTTLTINLTDITLIADNQTAEVNEAALDLVQDGVDLAAGTVEGSDPGSTGETVTGTLAVAGNGVTYTPITETTVNGEFELLANGSYTYTLHTPVDGDTMNDGPLTEPAVDQFTYTATDANGNTITGEVTIDVVDDVPTANADGVIIIPEDTAIEIDALGNDVFGADGVDTAVDVSIISQGTLGTASYDTVSGQFTYTPNDGENGPDSFTYQIIDGDGDISTAVVTVNISADSMPVVQEVNNATVDEDGFTNANVDAVPLDPLETDSTGLGLTDSQEIVIDFGADVPAVLDGSLVLNDTAALDGQLMTLDGQSVTFALAGGELVGTVDAGATEVIRIEIEVGATANGADVTYSYTVTLSEPVQHANNDDEDSALLSGVTFTATDSDGSAVDGTFDVSVVDDVPTAVDETAATIVEGDTLGLSGNVMTNDEQGADGADVTHIDIGVGLVAIDSGTEVSPGIYEHANANGTYTIAADGEWTFIPNDNLVNPADASFDYQLTDGDGDRDTATQDISVTDGAGPTVGAAINLTLDEDDLPSGSDTTPESLADAANLSFTAGSDAITSIVFGTDLSNLTADGDLASAAGAITWARVSDTQITGSVGGDVVVTLDLVVTTPVAAGASTSAQVTMTLSGNLDNTLSDDIETNLDLGSVGVVASEADGDSVTGTVNLSVVDDVPTAILDAVNTAEDTMVIVDVVANDVSGADAPATLTGATVDTAGAGTVSINALTGEVTFSPADGFDGPAVITYTIEDTDGDESASTLTVTVAPDSTPTVTVTDLTVDEDGLPDGTNALSDSETDTGSMTINTSGDDLQTVEVQDGSGAWIDVTAATLGAPITVMGDNGILTVTSDGTGNYDYSYTLADNIPAHPDFDPLDGDGISGADDPLAGDAFDVRVTDDDGSISPIDTINVTVLDDAPEAADDSVNQADQNGENTDVTIDVLSNDAQGADGVDVDTGVEFVSGTLSGMGTLIDNGDGTFTYTPAAEESGPITFDYQITDADNDVSVATATINLVNDSVPAVGASVAAVDDDGLAGGNTASIIDDLDANVGDDAGDTSEATFTGSLDVAFGGDTPGSVDFSNLHNTTGTVGQETVTYTWAGATLTATGPRGVLFTIEITDAATGDYEITLVDNVLNEQGPNEENASDTMVTLVFTATDADGSVNNNDGTLTITFDDDAPTAVVDAATATEDTLVNIDVFANDAAGADGVDMATGITFDDTGTNGTVTYLGDGTFDFTPTAGSVGPTSFMYTIVDADGDTATQTVTITVGADSTPMITTENAEVDEDGLSDANTDTGQGTETPSTGLATDTGTITVEYGNDTPADLLAAFAFNNTGLDTQLDALGADVEWAVSSDGLTLTGTSGTTLVMTIEITNAADNGGGSVVYTYEVTLAEELTHPANDSEDSVSLTGIQFTVTDSDSSAETGSFDVVIVDDVPVMNDFSDVVVPNVAGTYTMNNGLSIGADQEGAIDIAYTGETLEDVTYSTESFTDGDGNIGTRLVAENSDGDTLFTFSLDADGDYTFDLVTPDAASTEVIDLTGLAPGNGNFRETNDGSVEFTTAAGQTVNPSTQGFGVNNQFINSSEYFDMEFHTPGAVGDEATGVNPDFVNAVSFDVNSVSNGSPHVYEWTLTNSATGQTATGTVSISATGTFLIDPSDATSFTGGSLLTEFDQLHFEGVSGGGQGVRLLNANVSRTVLPEDAELAFEVTVTDEDGDAIVHDINVTIDPDATMVNYIKYSAPEEGTPDFSSFADLVQDGSAIEHRGSERSGMLEMAAVLGLASFASIESSETTLSDLIMPYFENEISAIEFEASNDSPSQNEMIFDPVLAFELSDPSSADTSPHTESLRDFAEMTQNIEMMGTEPVALTLDPAMYQEGGSFELEPTLISLGDDLADTGIFVDEGIDALLEQAMLTAEQTAEVLMTTEPGEARLNSVNETSGDVVMVDTSIIGTPPTNATFELIDDAQLLMLTHLAL